MDLRGIANGISNTVNGNIIVSVQASTGTTAGAGFRQVPAYAAPVTGPAQIQALTNKDIRQLDGLNIQGVTKAIYLRGPLAGVVRPTGQGGDLVIIAAPAPVSFIGTWLVVQVLESWPTWTKVAIQLQGGV